LFFVNERNIFLIIRKPITGIKKIKTIIPRPGTQGPVGDIFSKTSTTVNAMA
jgi:hypothetical protein